MHDPTRLGQNIRHYRKAQGLTQSALAQKLFVSAQNVSKWENGLCAPDVQNLCLLAEALGVSLDRLLAAQSVPARRVMIGIDGGGTKTEFVLFDEDGHVLGRERLGGTNPNIYGSEGTQSTLKKGIDALTVRENGVVAIFAGIAGCGVESNRRAVLSFLKKTYPGVRIEVRNDAYNVIYSTPYFERCAMAIMGTGSSVFAKTPTEFVRLGGWGFLFDNGFSGYAIARDGLMAALAAEDHTAPHTLLLDMLQKELGGGIFENIATLYSLPMEKIAAYAKHVFDAYRMGDSVAKEILQHRADVLTHFLDTATKRHDTGTRVILAGGLLRDRSIVMELLKNANYEFIIPDLPPIFGACNYAARMLGEPPQSFTKTFEKTYTEIIKE